MASATVVLITGANRGVGLAFAKLYAKRPNHVVVGACRCADDVEATRDLRREGCIVIKLDVSSDESCATLASQLKGLQIEKVDLLINNAGIGSFDDINTPSLLSDALEQFNVNALGPLRVTRALLPLLKASPEAKVVSLSSKMGSCSANVSGRYYGYRSSKAAMNIISLNLAHDLVKDNIACLLLNPGLIRTRLNDNNADMDADEAVAMMVENVIEKRGLSDGDKFFDRTGKVIEW